tara:strand:+ start:356 stop:1063 length:708 start_codon:yes stop_codon:yes gene_type:complete
MALPKLNSNPKYELNVPSTGTKVRFRPFLVKEEKALMIAMESGNQKDALNGLVDTIHACAVDNLDTGMLTTFDIEYIFLQLRTKSVGETANVNLKCTSCGTVNKITIPLDDIKVDVPDIDKKIQLDTDISIEVDWPRFKDVVEMGGNDVSNADSAFNVIGSCIKAIYTADERINVNEVSKEELQEFLESMNSAQFSKLKDFVELIPKLKHDVSFSCKNCASSNNITVEGVESFLL